DRTAGRDDGAVMDAGPGAGLPRVDAGFAVDDAAVEGVLDERAVVAGVGAEEALVVGLVVGEQQAAAGRGVEEAAAEAVLDQQRLQRHGAGVVGDEAEGVGGGRSGLDDGARQRFGGPRPGVAEPEVRQDVQRRGVGAAVVRRDADADVLGAGLGVLDDDVEVAIIGEDTGVEQFVLGLARGAAAGFGDAVGVGGSGLRVLVEVAEVRAGGGGVEVEVGFLDVVAVVAFGAAEAEEAFLEDGVAFVPQGEGEDEELVAVAEAGEAVLAPAVGAGAGVVVGEVVPGVAVGAV